MCSDTPDRSLFDVFDRLADLDPDRFARALDREPDLSPEARRRLKAMHGLAAGAEDCLDGLVRVGIERLAETPEAVESSIDSPLPAPVAASVPKNFGPYRVVREMGRGGLSTVYLAERRDPQMRVAVKVVRPDLASPELRQRLRRERQILADLDHPNIARIFDGGTTDSGSPFFVMEHIEGRHIDELCRQENLPLKRRIELFLNVAAAVEYAHRKLILHRDLKPSNILVTDDGTAKLLDFGIAKILQPADGDTAPLTEATLTRPGMSVFTPEYASPEQIAGEPLTTASDVYSLGVVLYLLITGERPYTFSSYSVREIEKVATEQLPSPPSSRLNRRPDDLDTIVLKALRKAPERRYGSPAQLANDLRRYLRGEPVLARKDTFSYRAARFIGRHRLAVAVAGLMFLTLLGAVGVTSWQAREALAARAEAEQSRDLAQRQKQQAESIVGFLTRLFEVSDPYRARGREVSAREMLDQGARRIRRELVGDPELKAELMAVMGGVYRRLSLFDEAEGLTREALELLTARGAEDGPEMAARRRDLARILIDRGDCQGARELLLAVVMTESRLDSQGAGLADTLHELAAAESKCNLHSQAEASIERALLLRQELFGPLSVEALDSDNRRGSQRIVAGRFDQAAELLGRVLDQRVSLLGADHPSVYDTRNELALALQLNGQREEAAEIFEETLVQQRRLLGNNHDAVAVTLYNLAVLRHEQGEIDQAEAFYSEALEVVREVFGPGHPFTAGCLEGLGRLAKRREDFPEAERLLRLALEIRVDFFGAESAEVAKSGLDFAGLLAETDPQAAEVAYLENIDLHDRVLGAADFRVAYPRVSLGRLLLKQKEARRAEPFLRQSLDIWRRTLPPTSPEIARVESYLGRSLLAQERLDEAEEVLESSYQRYSQSLGPDHSRTRAAAKRLAKARARLAS